MLHSFTELICVYAEFTHEDLLWQMTDVYYEIVSHATFYKFVAFLFLPISRYQLIMISEFVTAEVVLDACMQARTCMHIHACLYAFVCQSMVVPHYIAYPGRHR